jgi:hypothetical protein
MAQRFQVPVLAQNGPGQLGTYCHGSGTSLTICSIAKLAVVTSLVAKLTQDLESNELTSNRSSPYIFLLEATA